MKNDNPILFKTYMAHAIEADLKTATRRPIKQKTEWLLDSDWDDSYIIDPQNGLLKYSPYGQVGGNIWVRETFWQWGCYEETGELTSKGKKRVRFKGEGKEVMFHNPYDGGRKLNKFELGWHCRPSIFMPRWACKLELTITDVKIERLNDISEADAKREGIVCFGEGAGNKKLWCHFGALRSTETSVLGDVAFTANTAVEAFKLLWEGINGKGSWDENPLVWVTEFKQSIKDQS